LKKEFDEQRVARQRRSEDILRSAGDFIQPSLPAIEVAEEIQLRSVAEIAQRAICLLIVAAKGSELDSESIEALTEAFGVAKYFTPKERAFIIKESPSEQDLSNFSWRSESTWVLLWALGFVNPLGLPLNQIAPDDAIQIVDSNGLEGLIASAEPRSADEVLDEADLIYRCHWAVRQADLTGTDVPGGLEPGVTFERHCALNWLIGYEGQEWDDISTDT